MKKKGQMSLGNVPATVITLVVLALVIAVSSIVLTDFRGTQESTTCVVSNVSNQDGCSQAFNATTDGLTSIDNISGQMGTVGTIVIAAVLLGLIVTAFVYFNRR